MTTKEAKDIVLDRLPGCNSIDKRKAWQKLVTSGEVWRMSYKVQQYACAMIDAGIIERNAA